MTVMVSLSCEQLCIWFLWLFCVLVPPELQEGPGRVEGIEGEEAVIRCQASGMPRPTFSFFKVRIAFVARLEKNCHFQILYLNLGV